MMEMTRGICLDQDMVLVVALVLEQWVEMVVPRLAVLVELDLQTIL
tara:strand:+ start:193 stop:330 length:138 start_codon:yes stop_codon:yes gene_type:complete